MRDADIYTCVARNLSDHYAKQSIIIDADLNHFKVYERHTKKAPKIVGIYETGKLSPGNEYRMECLSDIENTDTKWTFNGTEITQNGQLFISSLEHTNEGVYECTVSNPYGSDRKSILVSIPKHSITDSTDSNNRTKPTISIQVLSNPVTDHVANGQVKLKCISGKQKKHFPL